MINNVQFENGYLAPSSFWIYEESRKIASVRFEFWNASKYIEKSKMAIKWDENSKMFILCSNEVQSIHLF